MTLQSLRDMLKDERVASVAARVALHNGESARWEVNGEGQVIVSVITHRGVPIWAILDGGPVWEIPASGTEVIVTFDDGDFEGDAYIAAKHPKSPTGLTDRKALVISDAVEIRSDGGTAQLLALKADLDSLKTAINGWTPIGGDGGAALKTALTSLFTNWPVGTTKVKAE